MLDTHRPVAVYMEGALGERFGKMGYGVLRYSPNPIVALIDSTHAGRDAAEFGPWRHAPVVATIDEAHRLGAAVLILGIAPLGGVIPEAWYADLDHAVARGLSLVNGLHDKLRPRYPNLQPGQFVWDVREEPTGLSSGTGVAARLPNKRVLMVGTDMAVGKMTAGLELHRLALLRHIESRFVATGQIGMTITGGGIPLDAIRVDFASGAVEREVLAGRDAEVIVIEGQGALCHPGSTSLLALMRGACPTHLILCAKAGQTHLQSAPHVAVPPLRPYIRLHEELGEACGTFPRPRVVAVALNTVDFDQGEADQACRNLENELEIPVCDPVRHSAERLLAALVD